MGELSDRRHDTYLSRTLKSDRHAELWLRSLEFYAFPKIGWRPIQLITSADGVMLFLVLLFDDSSLKSRLLPNIDRRCGTG
jgi:hypothetical protein